MVEERVSREGLGLMGVGVAVFVVAALVAAVVSPLAGELDRTIRDGSSPVAQAALRSEDAVQAPPAVKVLRLPPMFAVTGPSRAPVDEPAPAQRGLGHGRGLALAAQGPTRLSPTSPPAAPAPTSAHIPPVDAAVQAPTELPQSKPAPGRSGDAPPDRKTPAPGDPRGGDKPSSPSEQRGPDATMQASAVSASADGRPSRGSKRRRR